VLKGADFVFLDDKSQIKTLPYHNYIEPSLDAESGVQGERGHRALEDLSPLASLSRFESDGLLKNGKPRLACAKAHFLESGVCDIDGLMNYYKTWRDFDEFMVLHRAESDIRDEKKTIAVKCSKRGNDVYGRRTEKRLRFLKATENLEFFSPKDFDCKQVVHTSLLWVTLSWDTNFCGLKESWESGQYYFNLWITNLRNHYGRIDVLRFPQASPDRSGKAFGYLHFHVVLLFRDCEFTVFPYLNDKLEMSYRIEEKDVFDNQGKWHSFTDVRAISSMKGIYQYAIKHYENAGFGTSEEATLNNAMSWIFKKKSYTVSGGFRETYSEFIKTLRNSKVSLVQIDLFCEEHKAIWKFIGIFSIFELCKEYPDINFNDKWSIELPYCAWNPRADSR
jgi:hypothetical protein